MYTCIGGQLGVERCRHHTSLSHQDRVVAAPRENFHVRANPLDARCANEYHLQRPSTESTGGLDDAGVNLSSVGVAADGDVERVQARLMWILDLPGQHDGSRAGAERWLTVDVLVQFSEARLVEQLEKGGGFSTGNHQAVDFIELLGLADEYDLRAEFFEAAAMGIEIALQCEDTDLHNAALSN